MAHEPRQTDCDEWSGVGDLLELLSVGWPEWHRDALCREYPAVSWFPVKGEAGAEAKAVCRRCLAQSECRTWALEQDSTLDGIWGGLSRADRALIRRGKAA